MTTENQIEPQEQNQEQAPQLSPVEQKALEQGWKPKDQFEGDAADFIDAPEFVRRGELFQKIEKQSREVRQLKEALEAFKQHHTKVKEVEYARALKAVEAERRQAFADGDHDKFFALEQQIDAIKEEASIVKAEAKAPVVPEVPPALEDWISKNTWYQSNRAMTALADRIGMECRQANMPVEKALQKIDEEIRKEFPEKFNRSRPPSPEGATRTGTGASRSDSFKMSDEERVVMRKIVGSGVMTEAEYIKELKKVKGV